MMTKRIFSALLAAALSLSLLAGCGSTSGSTASSAADGPQRYSTVFYDVFDTVTQVIAYCDSEEEFTAQMDALHADLVEYNQLYDIYNDYDGVTNIKTINDNAGTAPVTVDDKILGMLELAQTMYDTTGGKLNIALGSVLNIWHNYREAALAADNDSHNQLPTQSWMQPHSTAISPTSSLMKMPKRSIWPTRPCRWTWAAWARATPWSRPHRPPKPGA